jgi:tRNA (mo5U34)-methyltransferase
MNLGPDLWTNPTWEGAGPDYPAWRWKFVQPILPDVKNRTCLDIGCSSGFFSLKLKELGAKYVLGVDDGEQRNAIQQASFAASCLGLQVDFRHLSVYDVGSVGKSFDVVLFLGVFYHLRNPMLALDALRRVCTETLLIQTITTPHHQSQAQINAKHDDVDLHGQILNEPEFPLLRFVEGRLNGDPSCWFVPSVSAVTAMLRSAGFEVEEVVFPTSNEIIVRCRAI